MAILTQWPCAARCRARTTVRWTEDRSPSRLPSEGFYALKTTLRQLGPRVIDKRTSIGKALAPSTDTLAIASLVRLTR